METKGRKIQLAGKSTQLGREKNEMEVEMTETKLLTAKELADETGVSPQVLRKLLRKDFDQVHQTLVVEGDQAKCISVPVPSVTKDITARAKELSHKPQEPQPTANTGGN